jgi:hypothetical protein
MGPKRFLVTRHDGVADLDRADLTNTMRRWRDKVVAEHGLIYRRVDSTTGTIDVHDPAVALHVLGPRLIPGQAAPVYPWLGSAPETVNGHSVVLRLDVGDLRILFPGDINRNGLDT